MRIVAGRLRGRKIAVAAGSETRPTTDRVREAIFSALGSRVNIEGARVLDLFAGSGALGIEALSRGAAYAVFVESSRRALAVLRQNISNLGLEGCTQVVPESVATFLGAYKSAPFDIVLADPPYDLPGINALPGLVSRHILPGGTLVLEHEVSVILNDLPGEITTKTYGRTGVSFIEVDDTAPPES